MASIATLEVKVSVFDGERTVINEQKFAQVAVGAGTSGSVEEVSCTGSTFTALSPPSGAVAAIIFIPTTAISLTLKGVTGDSGVAISPASNVPGLPLVVPLGASPSIGITNGNATARTVRVVWI